MSNAFKLLGRLALLDRCDVSEAQEPAQLTREEAAHTASVDVVQLPESSRMIALWTRALQ